MKEKAVYKHAIPDQAEYSGVGTVLVSQELCTVQTLMKTSHTFPLVQYIVTGSLAVGASNNLHHCVVCKHLYSFTGLMVHSMTLHTEGYTSLFCFPVQVKGTLVMNVLSTITAAIAIILLSLDCVITPYRPCNYYYDGMVQCERVRSLDFHYIACSFGQWQK